MLVTFYEFSKKGNSTKQPTGEGTSFNCNLKHECSILSPTITLELDGAVASAAPLYNYCYISVFHRYYFVSNWTYFQGLWSADLSVDVLATYKSAIGQSRLYVLRSASSYNGSIIDTTYPLKYHSTYDKHVASQSDAYFRCYNSSGVSYSSNQNYRPWNKDFTDGYVVLGVSSEEDNGVTFYLMTCGTFVKFYRWLADAFPTEGWTGIVDGVKKAFYKPLSYITQCYWIPSNIYNIPLTNNTIHVGELSLTDSTYVMSEPLDILDDTCEWRMRFDIIDHPLTSDRGLWLNSAPYTELYLELFPFGLLSLPMSKLSNCDAIVASIKLDLPTGNAELIVYGADDIQTLKQPIYHTTSKWGVSLPIVQGTVDYLSMATSAIGIMATGYSAMALHDANLDLEDAKNATYEGSNLVEINENRNNAIASAEAARDSASKTHSANIKKIPTNIGNFGSSIERQVSSTGSPGSAIAFNGMVTPTLHAQFFYPVSEDLANKGRPLCEVKTISTLNGFIKCSTGDIDMFGTQQENEAVESYLTSGFFYE